MKKIKITVNPQNTQTHYEIDPEKGLNGLIAQLCKDGVFTATVLNEDGSGIAHTVKEE